MNKDELKTSILALPIEERMEIYHALEAGIFEHTPKISPEMEAMHLAIVEERMAKLKAGLTKTIPWKEVRKKLFTGS